MTKFKVGIFGSSAGELDSLLPRAHELGEELSQYPDSVIVITGGAAGLPYQVAKDAAAGGVEVWGYSAYPDRESHEAAMPDDDHSIYAKLIYVPREFPYPDNLRARMKYRNVISTAICDAGIIISGRWGSLNEFTNLIDMQKTIGVLTGTGGIADELPELTRKITKEGQGEIYFDDNPKSLVEKLLDVLKSQESFTAD